MAYDKVVDSSVLDVNLTSVANAIREKAGSSDSFAFPQGFIDAISAIETGVNIELPNGYAMEMGTYVPSSDVTYIIELELKNTYRWSTYDRTGNTFASMFSLDVYSGIASMMAGIVFYNYAKKTGSRNFCTSDAGVISIYGGDIVGFSTNETSNLLRLRGTSSYPLKAGVRYFWIVIGEVV